ncbi:MAG: sigma-54 dependent transcriptional regulator, partial [Kiritimatiellia bacterium]|nr:sigma-54 dependent transcriptional regulator [Kiritimatiellia bacterium]
MALRGSLPIPERGVNLFPGRFVSSRGAWGCVGFRAAPSRVVGRSIGLIGAVAWLGLGRVYKRLTARIGCGMLPCVIETLILTGWGHAYYSAAAAMLLNRLDGAAEVGGVSIQRLPETLENLPERIRRVILLGIGLQGDEWRLATALEALHSRGTTVEWVSNQPLSESQRQLLSAWLKCHIHPRLSLLDAVARTYSCEAHPFAPFAAERPPAGHAAAQAYRDLVAAASWAHRSIQDDEAYPQVIHALARLTSPSAWPERFNRLVKLWRESGRRELIGTSSALCQLRDQIARVAVHPDARVLILGESGTGKETVARQIHNLSPRAQQPFVAFNCATCSTALMEDRLFGHAKGAYTGAHSTAPGLFACAQGGTLFLDEVAELPLDAQTLLLRVLEEGRYLPLGATREEHADVRLLAATNRPLRQLVAQGRFREDLFWRLSTIELRIPPLRERPDDIPPIADAFYYGKTRRHLTPQQAADLQTYSWPGNVRELHHLLERAIILSQTDFRLLLADARQNLPEQSTRDSAPDYPEEPLDEHIRRYI